MQCSKLERKKGTHGLQNVVKYWQIVGGLLQKCIKQEKPIDRSFWKAPNHGLLIQQYQQQQKKNENKCNILSMEVWFLILTWRTMMISEEEEENKLASLDATLLRNYD